MPRGKGRSPRGVAGLLKRFVDWCNLHPVPVALTLVVGALAAVLSLAQSVDWLRAKLWPPQPEVIDFSHAQSPGIDIQHPHVPREILEEGSQWTVRIENPLDASIILTRATIRAEPRKPHDDSWSTTAAQVLRATASYRVPISCRPGSQTVTLDPPLKLDPKDIAEIVFKAPLGRYPCRLFVSFETNRGPTAERQATDS